MSEEHYNLIEEFEALGNEASFHYMGESSKDHECARKERNKVIKLYNSTEDKITKKTMMNISDGFLWDFRSDIEDAE